MPGENTRYVPEVGAQILVGGMSISEVPNLGLPGDTDAFMTELHAIQDADPAFWSTVYLHVLPDRFDIGEIDIDSLGILNHSADTAGKGSGRRMLDTLLKLADKHSVDLKLAASNDSVSTHFLEEWYGRHGFEETEDYSDYGPVMVRKPAPANSHTPEVLPETSLAVHSVSV